MLTLDRYYNGLYELKEEGKIELPYIPKDCVHNAHMFYIKLKNLEERTEMINFLREKGIYAVFHYVPLHTSQAGKKFGEFIGKDVYTTKESERLMRLPMFYGLKPEVVDYIVDCVKSFFIK